MSLFAEGSTSNGMEYLSKLFGSPSRVKLLRLFLFNPDTVYGRDDVVEVSRVTPNTASKELTALVRVGLVKRKTFYKEIARPGSKIPKKRKTLGYIFNPKFPYTEALTSFLLTTLQVADVDIRKRFKGVGVLHTLILAGFLIGDTEGVFDILIVGSRLNESSIQNAVRYIEAECGREIRYAILTVDDYEYRLRVRDKMVRDMLDGPHKVLINK
jgi:hypothetical protein